MKAYVSEIRIFAFPETPTGWAPCDGSMLEVNPTTAQLYAQIGTTFGGDGTHFKLPDLRDRVIIGSGPGYPAFAQGGAEAHELSQQEMPKHRHQAVASVNGSDSTAPKDHFWPSDAGYVTQSNSGMSDQATGQVGNGVPHNNMSPYLAINYCICVVGMYPQKNFRVIDDFTGTIRAFPEKVEAGWWVPCDGTILPMESYHALFIVIGWTYGGNRSTTFALPDLRGRATVNFGQPEGLTHYKLGQKGGEASVKLTAEQMPKHSHAALANTRGNTLSPDGHVWANEDSRPAIDCFASGKGEGAVMNPAAIGESGADQPHNNMMLYQTLEYMIAAGGDWPTPI